MCGPGAVVPLMIAGTVLSAASVAMSTISAVNQAKYEGEVARNNAHQANEAARDSIDQGKREQQQLFRQVSQTKGAQQAAAAANGIDTAFGSAGLAQRDTAQLASEDSAALTRNIESRTKGFDINAANFKGAASAASSRAFGAAVGGALDFGSTVLGGASQVAQYKRRQAMGMA